MRRRPRKAGTGPPRTSCTARCRCCRCRRPRGRRSRRWLRSQSMCPLSTPERSAVTFLSGKFEGGGGGMQVELGRSRAYVASKQHNNRKLITNHRKVTKWCRRKRLNECARKINTAFFLLYYVFFKARIDVRACACACACNVTVQSKEDEEATVFEAVPAVQLRHLFEPEPDYQHAHTPQNAHAHEQTNKRNTDRPPSRCLTCTPNTPTTPSRWWSAGRFPRGS